MTPGRRENLSDARLIGMAARAVRRARGMTAQQAATAMTLPLRTYEYFEAGSGRVNLDYVHRFAAATDCDPWALLLGPSLGASEFARQTADSKLMLIFLIALGEFVDRMGERLVTLDPRALIEAFTETFRKLEEENRVRAQETASWLDAGRDRLTGKPPEDGPD
jgi:transcriptional regulator with XRE-family HTH domain